MEGVVSSRLYDKWKADIESEYTPRIRELQTQLRELQEQRTRDLAALDKFWSELGSGEQLPLTEDGEGAGPESPGNDGDTSEANGSNEKPYQVVTPRKGVYIRPKRKRPIRKDVRDIVSELGDENVITQGQVRERYMQLHPDADSDKVRPSISHALRRLMEEGELERVSEGVASEPHKYRKTKSREQPVSD